MLGLKTSLQHAQRVKQYLLEHDLLDKRYQVLQEEEAIVFPVAREFSPPFDFDVEFVEATLDEREQQRSLREALSPLLSEREMETLVASYDIVGSIVIIDVPDELEGKARLIGEQILEVNKGAKTVLRKLGGHEGEYRTQRMQCIAGDDVRETTVVENGTRLRVNVEEAYYSIRMSTERQRIIRQIKPGERILCLFSGVGPYPVQFSKHTQAASITGVEINPKAHELAQENAATNRCTNVHLLLGDARNILPKLASSGERFDRVTMPLPHTAHEFLDPVLDVCKKGATVHYYCFQHENELEHALETVKAAVRRNGRRLGQYAVVKAGQHAPRIWRLCVDAEVE